MSPHETLGRKLYDLDNGQWAIPRLRVLLEEILQEDAVLTDFEVSASFAGRGPRVMLLNARRVERRDAEATRILLAIEDVTARRRAEGDLTEAALRDKLTGLYNRHGLVLLVSKLMERLRREGTSLRLLFADVDDLKSVNDRSGHAAGDAALVAVAEVLRATFRESDIVARYGGDEFLVILVGDDGDAQTASHRLEQAFKALAPLAGHRLAVSVGFVCAELATDLSLEDVITRADKAMYEEKRRRRAARRAQEPSSNV